MNNDEKANDILDEYYNKIEDWSARLLRIRKLLVQGVNPGILIPKLEEVKQDHLQFLTEQYQQVIDLTEQVENEQMSLSLSRKVHFIGMEQVILRTKFLNTEHFIKSLTDKESSFN